MKKICISERFGLFEATLRQKKTQLRLIVPSKFYEDKRLGDMLAKGKGKPPLPMHEIEVAPFKVGEMVALAQTYKELLETEYLSKEVEDEVCRLVEKGHLGCTNRMCVKAELMPHLIEFTDVRVENLQDITEEDCIKEGIVRLENSFIAMDGKKGVCANEAQLVFEDVFNAVSRRKLWDSNPKVFVYDFVLVI